MAHQDIEIERCELFCRQFDEFDHPRSEKLLEEVPPDLIPMATNRVPEICGGLLAVVMVFIDNSNDGARVLWGVEMRQGW